MQSTATLTQRPTALAQFFGIMRYELRILWRGRAWVASLLSIVLLITWLSMAFSASILFTDIRERMAAATPDALPALNTEVFGASTYILLTFGTIMHVLSLLVFPLLFADGIARDRQLGVREVMRALPLGEGTYLAAKVCAMMLVIGVTMLVGCMITIIMWSAIVWSFDIGLYLKSALLGFIPVAMLNGGLVMLIASLQPTRRRAFLLGIGVCFLTIFLMILNTATGLNWSNYLNPGRPIALSYNLSLAFQYIPEASRTSASNLDVFSVNEGHVLLGSAVAGLEIVLVWLVVRAWYVRRSL